MTAPKLAQSIPNANIPVRMTEVRESRHRYLAGVITGAVLASLCLFLMGVAVGVTL